MALTQEQIEYFIQIINEYSEYDFSQYSIKSLTRRVERVLVDYNIDFQNLITKVKKNADYREKVVKSITVNTTELFRDPSLWQAIKYRIIPSLKNNNRINIWHSGVSYGQELYSMLILLNEAGLMENTNIFGTDINSEVIETAKKGIYKYQNNMEYIHNYNKVIRQNPFNYEEYYDIPYTKYFTIDKNKDTLAMKPFLLKKPLFMKHDLVKQGNIFSTKFDIIFCRNVLIYFTSELQNKILQTFYDSMFKSSSLILGAHESILGPMTNKFQKKGLYYRKK